jgi:hypothetical protein
MTREMTEQQFYKLGALKMLRLMNNVYQGTKYHWTRTTPWELAICRLYREEYDPRLILDTISWLEEHYQDQNCPRVFNVPSFLKQFDRLQIKMKKQKRRQNKLTTMR